MEIKLVGSVIFVQDIQAATRFYQQVLGQVIDLDFGVNIGFVGGLALWQHEHATQVIFQRPAAAPQSRHNAAELYFETDRLEEVSRRVLDSQVEIIQPLAEQPWGSLAMRFYDLDGHIVEVGEPMSATVARMLGQGMSLEAVAQKTAMPLDAVRRLAAA